MKQGTYIRKKKFVACVVCGVNHEATRSDAKCSTCEKSKRAAKQARARSLHPERCDAHLANWRALNQDKVKAHKRKFQEARRAHRACYQQTRNAEKLRAVPSWADIDAINGMYELAAIFRQVGLDLHVDHIIPLKGKLVSGLHIADNLQLLHATENMKKKNRFSDGLV